MGATSGLALLRQQVDRWAETWLTAKFSRLFELRAQEPGPVNCPIAVFLEWRGKAVYLDVRYRARSRRPEDDFVVRHTRMALICFGRFDLEYFRHTDKWFTVYRALTAAECFREIEENEIFWPTNLMATRRTFVATRPHTVDEYLAGLSPENRTALQKVRRAVRAAAPEAEECISYGMPAFRWNGKLIAGFKVAANHCSFHPMSGDTVATLKADLAGYDTSRGTIRFSARAGLPATLVRKLVTARIAEVAR